VVPVGKDPFLRDGFQQVYAIDTGQASKLIGVPLAGDYLQLVDGQPGGLGVIALPNLDSGPFLSYGIQWIAFGIVAPFGLGYFIYSEIQARRREREQAEPQVDADGAATPVTVEQKLADRYGRRH
jgi:cytochrome oxidase assembly protein ShyY1